jgi:hypothetical protein
MFYTYLHLTTDGKPFYIGKGCGHRAWSKANRNNHWQRTVEKYGLQVVVLAEWATEEEAFEHEKVLIACFRDMGHKLVNRTDGGGGVSGLVMTAEWKQKKREFRTGKKHSVETRKKIAEANRLRVKKPESIEKQRTKIIGRKATIEQRLKQSLAAKGKKKPDGFGEKIRQARTGVPRTPETIERMRQGALATAKRKRNGTVFQATIAG